VEIIFPLGLLKYSVNTIRYEIICSCYVAQLAVRNCGVMTKSAKARFCDVTRSGFIGIMVHAQRMATK
jgi:hypothetical protein